MVLSLVGRWVPPRFARIHLTPGLGPRLPLTARAADVTRMEADGLLRVAISAEQVRVRED